MSIIAATGVGAYIFGSCGQESKIDAWRNRYNQYQDSVTKYVVPYIDSLIAQSKRDSTAAVAANDRANKKTVQLQILTDSTKKLTIASFVIDSTYKANIKNFGEFGQACVDKVKDDARRIGVLDSTVATAVSRDSDRVKAIALFSGQATKNASARDSLQKIIDNTPKNPPADKLLGFIPLPTRKAAFIMGAGTALLIDAFVHVVKIKL